MKQLLISTALAALTASHAFGQTASPTPTAEIRPSGAEAFTPANAILNTAILFAVGSHEAQQSLRNAFGWPTFQEGQVRGVYFRFDPDGYARFSPSPRLDTDVFEVICRPRTYSCMARKGPLGLTVAPDGRIQIVIEQAQATDTFALNDGFSELQLPPRVNGPLEPQLEMLLSGGGSLIVRRNGEPLEAVSLQGFSAVAAYLRWVGARQDYAVLPRDWPIPNGVAPVASRPSEAPRWPNTATRAAPVELASTASTLQSTGMGAGTGAPANPGAEFASLRAELAILRELLIRQTGNDPAPAVMAMSMTEPTKPRTEPNGAESGAQDLILEQLASLRQEIGLEPRVSAILSYPSPAGPMATLEMPTAQTNQTPVAITTPDEPRHAAAVSHLRYLTEVMDFDTKTALLIVQMSSDGQGVSSEAAATLIPDPATVILESLQKEQSPNPSDGASESKPTTASTPVSEDYQLLSMYFQSLVARQ